MSNELVLVLVLANNCPACRDFKAQHLDELLRRCQKENITVRTHYLESTRSSLKDAKVPNYIQEALAWFPFICICDEANGKVVGVFNASLDGRGRWTHNNAGQPPNADNIHKFFHSTKTSRGDHKERITIPSTPNSSIVYVPTSACKKGIAFTSR